MQLNLCFFFFFFNDTATTEIYTLSLHDALPICLFGQMAADLLSDERHILAQSWRASARRWLRSLKDAVSSRIGSMHGARAAVHGAQMTAPASISMPKGWTRVQKKAGEQCSPVRFSA